MALLVGVALWAAGAALVIGGSEVLGIALALVGSLAVIASLTSDREGGVWEWIWAWLQQLP